MTSLRGLRTAAAAASLLVLAACAQPSSSSSAAAAPSASSPASPDDLILRVASVGGFVTPDMRAGRLPTTSIYADGRVIVPGPEVMIYPGPALPNLQIGSITPEQAQKLVEEAVAAGVRTGADFGQPGVTDIPATRITAGDQTVGVEALREAQADDPALTAAQKDARAKLTAFLEKLDRITSELQTTAYEPEVLAAVVSPYVEPGDDQLARPQAVDWPGEALPGEPIGAGLHCVTAAGDQKENILAAAKTAVTTTPWVSGGNGWSVRLRPLLPDETGCGDLKDAQ